MKNPNTILWKCVVCGEHTTTLHEVFFGSADRDIAIFYNIQVSICPFHHNIAHGATVIDKPGVIDTCIFDSYTEKQCKQFFCTKLDIDYKKTLRGFEDSSREYLKSVKQNCLRKLKLWAA